MQFKFGFCLYLCKDESLVYSITANTLSILGNALVKTYNVKTVMAWPLKAGWCSGFDKVRLTQGNHQWCWKMG